MKILLMLFGRLVTIAGLLFIGQGMGVIKWPADSFMIGQTRWIYIGAVIVVFGIAQTIVARRMKL